MLIATLAGLLLLLGGPVPIPTDDAEIVAQFLRYIDDDRSPDERRQAVLTLEGTDSVEAAEALFESLVDPDDGVRDAAIAVIGAMDDPAVGAYLVEEVLEDRRNSRDEVLVSATLACLGAMDYTRAIDAILALTESRDEAVRLAAVHALGELGDPAAVHTLSMLAREEDDVPLVIASLEALAAIGADAGADAVLGAMEHPEWRVRASAIEAVVTLRLKAGVDALIERLRVEEGRLAGDAYQALQDLTFNTLPDDPERWQRWWDRNRERFVLPDPVKVAEARAKRAREGTRYSAGQAPKFLGIETRSENITFVIDVSGSMETLFGDRARLEATGRQYSSLQRLAIVKQELIETIRALPEETDFNILAFASDVDPWKRKAVRANVLNKNDAIEWVEKLKPIGGSQSSFRARTGLLSNTSEGETNTHLAILTALGEEVDADGRRGTRSRSYTADPKNPVDTVFFLTDGEPTTGVTTDMGQILAEVERVNAYRNIQIHVIYVGAFGGKEFERLARDNGGVFVAIGG